MQANPQKTVRERTGYRTSFAVSNGKAAEGFRTGIRGCAGGRAEAGKKRREDFAKTVDSFPPFVYNSYDTKSIKIYRIIAARGGKAEARFRRVLKGVTRERFGAGERVVRARRDAEKTYREVEAMVLKVCVGSSCHLRGSYDVIEEMKRLIKKYGVEDKVDLQATFCVGNCTNGVSVLADEMLLHNANKDNCEELFLTQVYPLIK